MARVLLATALFLLTGWLAGLWMPPISTLWREPLSLVNSSDAATKSFCIFAAFIVGVLLLLSHARRLHDLRYRAVLNQWADR